MNRGTSILSVWFDPISGCLKYKEISEENFFMADTKSKGEIEADRLWDEAHNVAEMPYINHRAWDEYVRPEIIRLVEENDRLAQSLLGFVEAEQWCNCESDTGYTCNRCQALELLDTVGKEPK